ncbi:MAG: toprim domain-containing protein [Thermoanaerobaculales bacterium]|nr:toprim domain-containing protein [Thermoanaerobaculales bacterium]
MARIPDHELNRLKRDTDLAALVRSRGVKLKPQGKDLVGLCVLHDDKSPSLVVTPSKNLWHCLGCGQGGSVVDWVMKTEGVSFRHAVEILREGNPGAGVRDPESEDRDPKAAPKRSLVPKLPAPVELDASAEELMQQVVGYYHSTLLNSPEAMDYLKQRGIDHPEAVSAFKLGYANRTLGLRLPPKKRKDGARMRHQLTKLGIIRPSGHEHLNGCLTIPVFDAEGRVTQIYGRKIVHHLKNGSVYHLYLPGPRRGVFNLDAFRTSKEIILCESLIDALTFWRHGFQNVTSSWGASGFTDEHLEVMKAYGAERVLIAYDRDEAGDKGAEDVARRLSAEGIACFRVLFPKSMDANAYARKVTPAAQSLAVLLRSAQYIAGPLSVARDPLPEKETPRGESHHPPAEQSVEEPMNASLITEAEPISPLAAGPGPHSPVKSQEIPASSVHRTPKPSKRTTENGQPTTDPGQRTPEPASPVPPPPRVDIPAEVNEQEVVIRLDDRRWRVRGLAKNMSFEQLRINLFVGLDGRPDRFHLDTFDLYSAKQRSAFIRQATTELGLKETLVKKDLGMVLLKLEELQELQIRKALEPKQTTVTIDEADRQAALALLRDPRLLDRIAEDFERCGVVGEETNKLVGYLAAVSRKLERPLAVMIQSSSAAGKSSLMNAVLSFVPDEERVAYSAMTGQSLFYMDITLKHKILAIAEEEGAQRASYALKQLQTEGELSIASTGKDPATGRLVTHEYRVEGPVMLVMTTTAIDLDEELMNRCVVLSVDEGREQTRAIHRMQRESQTLEGLLARRRRARVLELHRNAQRLLRPLPVLNPFAQHLTFPTEKTRMRRDHLKYLGLIEAVTLLHQHQRERRVAVDEGEQVEHLVVSLPDIEIANRLAAEVLGRTLDELPPQSRRLLCLLHEMVVQLCQEQEVAPGDVRFTRAQARRHSGWSYDQVRVHLDRLAEMEYLLIHHGRRGQSFIYELLYDGEGQEGDSFLLGLIDVDRLRQATTEASTTTPDEGPTMGDQAESLGGQKRSLGGEQPGFGGPFGPHLAPIGVPLGTPENDQKANAGGHSPADDAEEAEKTHIREVSKTQARRTVDDRRTDRTPPSLAAAAPAARGESR